MINRRDKSNEASQLRTEKQYHAKKLTKLCFWLHVGILWPGQNDNPFINDELITKLLESDFYLERGGGSDIKMLLITSKTPCQGLFTKFYKYIYLAERYHRTSLDTQTDRQTPRQTDRQTDRQTNK